MMRPRILTLAAVTLLLSLGGCKKDAPAPTPAPAPEAKPAEAKPAEAKPAEAKPAEAKPAEAKPAEAPLSEEKKALILNTAVDLACAAVLRSPAEVAAMKNGRMQQHGWKAEEFDAWTKQLMETDAAYQTQYKSRVKACPSAEVDEATKGKAEAIYVDLVCLTKQGLPRDEVAKKVPEIYGKHGMTGPEYSTAMRTLLKDRSFGQALAKKIQDVCPGPAKAPTAAALANAKNKKPAGPAGTFKGSAKGLKGFGGRVMINLSGGKVKSALASIDGANWPLRGKLAGDKITLIGKRGNNALTFTGTIRGKKIVGKFQGSVGGVQQQGSWSASK